MIHVKRIHYGFFDLQEWLVVCHIKNYNNVFVLGTSK